LAGVLTGRSAGAGLSGGIPFTILLHVADEWDVYIVDEVREWIGQLDDATHRRVVQAIDALAEGDQVWDGRWSIRSPPHVCRT
jgi:hypothetical protein